MSQAARASDLARADHPWAARLGILWRPIAAVGTALALSLAWLLALGLVLPLPAVTAAVLRVCLALARGRSPNAAVEFMAGIQESWRRATVLGLVSLIAAAILVVDLWILDRAPDDTVAIASLLRGALLTLGVWGALISVYAWPLVGGTAMSTRAILMAAVGLSLVELPWAFAALVGILGAVLLLVSVPVLLVFIGPAVIAVVWAGLSWRGLRRHLAGPDSVIDPETDSRVDG